MNAISPRITDFVTGPFTNRLFLIEYLMTSIELKSYSCFKPTTIRVTALRKYASRLSLS